MRAGGMAQGNPLPASPSHLPHSWHSHACSNPLFPPFPRATPPPIRKSSFPSSCTLQPFTPVGSTSDNHPITTERTPQHPALTQKYICRITNSGIWLRVNPGNFTQLSARHSYFFAMFRSAVSRGYEYIHTHTPSTSTHIHTKRSLPLCLSREDAP